MSIIWIIVRATKTWRMTMLLVLVIPTLLKEKRFTEVKNSPPLGISFLLNVSSTTSTAISQAIIISGKGVEVSLFECQCISANAKLMTQVIMVILSWFQLTAQNSMLGSLTANVGWSHSPWRLFAGPPCTSRGPCMTVSKTKWSIVLTGILFVSGISWWIFL